MGSFILEVIKGKSIMSTQGSFQEAIGPVLRFSQVFAIMPVNGVNSKEISNIKFKWKSFKAVYSLLLIACGTIEFFLCVRLVLKRGLTLGYASALAYYFAAVFGAFCFFRLSMKWQQSMKRWYELEKVFLQAVYAINGRTLKRKIQLWSAVIGLMSLRNYVLPLESII